MDRQSAVAAREMNKAFPTITTIPKWIIMCCRPLWALSIPFHFDNETVLVFYPLYIARQWLSVDWIFAHSMYRAGTVIFSSFSSSSLSCLKAFRTHMVIVFLLFSWKACVTLLLYICIACRASLTAKKDFSWTVQFPFTLAFLCINVCSVVCSINSPRSF